MTRQELIDRAVRNLFLPERESWRGLTPPPADPAHAVPGWIDDHTIVCVRREYNRLVGLQGLASAQRAAAE